MLTLLLRQSTGKLEAEEVWNTGMENAASNSIMATEDHVQTKLNNEEFFKYIYNNARLMFNTTTISNEKTRETYLKYSTTHTRVTLPTR